MSKPRFHAVLVLSDGETWETIGSQSICIITEEDYERLCNDEMDARDLTPVVEMGLKDYTRTGD